MSDLWLIEYEKVAEEYTRDCVRFGENEAERYARKTLKLLGFDPHEIDEQISELKL